ncbi:hypothetical protein [Magnetofaba australis]|uniref:Uncharacterized protein n=1 Tax=Magnetofaba australis IT-1 TaxID=1434232 RepID=A0A1Y2K122_9PROT|nr:hypothetical protein [Magnetofaba australis]OSM01743.1 hypothetical protein MAIT1_01775 [Magnetofaba australis IT-1]
MNAPLNRQALAERLRRSRAQQTQTPYGLDNEALWEADPFEAEHDAAIDALLSQRTDEGIGAPTAPSSTAPAKPAAEPEAEDPAITARKAMFWRDLASVLRTSADGASRYVDLTIRNQTRQQLTYADGRVRDQIIFYGVLEMGATKGHKAVVTIETAEALLGCRSGVARFATNLGVCPGTGDARAVGEIVLTLDPDAPFMTHMHGAFERALRFNLPHIPVRLHILGDFPAHDEGEAPLPESLDRRIERLAIGQLIDLQSPFPQDMVFQALDPDGNLSD